MKKTAAQHIATRMDSKLSFVICCLGMPFDGETIFTETIGGSESAAYYTARNLASMGHKVTVFTSKEKPVACSHGVKYIYAGAQSDAAPMGSDFHFYAENTPHDVLIIQRAPGAFARKYASKINILWLHDLARPEHKNSISASLWNLDLILCVSDYHSKQVSAVYGIPLQLIDGKPNPIMQVLRNGVDTAAIDAVVSGTVASKPDNLDHICPKNKRLFYMSRPERGLDRLVFSIMQDLPDHHLFFCTYNNVTSQMAPVYESIWRKAASMPNVHNLGFLNKQELYGYMSEMGLMVYPTPGGIMPDFREVSCIALMEAARVGLPVLTSPTGALMETGKGGVRFEHNDEDFVEAIVNITESGGTLDNMKAAQLASSTSLDWTTSTVSLINHVMTVLSNSRTGRMARIRGAIDRSAISAIAAPHEFGEVVESHMSSEFGQIPPHLAKELKECYKFYPNDSYTEHYREYYDYEKRRGVIYGPEDITHNSRFNTVLDHTFSAENNVYSVLDYGCAHGHYTITMAKMYPHVSFVGIDITESNIKSAREWAEQEGLTNVRFELGQVDHITGKLAIVKDESSIGKDESSIGKDESPIGKDESPIDAELFDVVICAEVLEHVRDPHTVLNGLSKKLNYRGKFVITTPFGPWEAQGYAEHWPWRAHVHDFNIDVINEYFGRFDDFNIQCVPSGCDKRGRLMGSYVYSFTAPTPQFESVYGKIDWGVKSDVIGKANEQSVSLCMIFKGEFYDLARCLVSVKDLVAEIVIGFDASGDSDVAKQVATAFARDHHISYHGFDIKSPMITGFDEARNSVIRKATGDWVLWLDSDEVIYNTDSLRMFLRDNMYMAYAIKQDHFSVEPPGVLKTDLPCKLFRNGVGAHFIGRIHEHPEIVMNKGMGDVMVLPGVHIAHYGYDNENTRRERFARNFALLEKDRADYPDREMGHFFWLRDMAQLVMFSREHGASIQDSKIVESVASGLAAFSKVITCNNLRMIVESLQFYSVLVEVDAALGGTKAVSVTQDVVMVEDGSEGKPLSVKFVAKNHADATSILNRLMALNIEGTAFNLHLDDIPSPAALS